MADKTSDTVDRLLAAAFSVEPIADDGFSDRIVSKLRRRIWINRLALPTGILVGLAFALKPALQLGNSLLPLLDVVPVEIARAPMQFLPQLQYIIFGGMAVAAGITLIKMLEET